MKTIRESIDRSLSATRFDSWDRQAVWSRLEEPSARQLHSPLRVVILVVLLLAMFATALAFTLSKAYFDDVAALQSKSGYYDDWSLDEKLHFFNLMIDYGAVTETPELAAILNDPMDDAAREAAMDAFAAKRYGIEGRTDVIGLESILIKEKGELRYWSLEDMAWYTQLHEKHGILGYDVCLMSVPGDDVIQPDEAIAIAKAAVINAYELPSDGLDSHRALVEYSIHRSLADQYDPFYIVTFEGQPTYYCGVDNEGNIMSESTHPQYFGLSPYEEAAQEKKWAEEAADRSAHMEQTQQLLEDAHGPMYTWSAEVFHLWAPDYYQLPAENELSFAAACEIARDALQKANPEHYTEEILDQFITNGFLIRDEYDESLSCWRKHYYINFVDKAPHPESDAELQIAFVCVDALTGEVINLEDYTDPSQSHGNG